MKIFFVRRWWERERTRHLDVYLHARLWQCVCCSGSLSSFFPVHLKYGNARERITHQSTRTLTLKTPWSMRDVYCSPQRLFFAGNTSCPPFFLILRPMNVSENDFVAKFSTFSFRPIDFRADRRNQTFERLRWRISNRRRLAQILSLLAQWNLSAERRLLDDFSSPKKNKFSKRNFFVLRSFLGSTNEFENANSNFTFGSERHSRRNGLFRLVKILSIVLRPTQR